MIKQFYLSYRRDVKDITTRGDTGAGSNVNEEILYILESFRRFVAGEMSKLSVDLQSVNSTLLVNINWPEFVEMSMHWKGLNMTSLLLLTLLSNGIQMLQDRQKKCVGLKGYVKK